MQHEYRFATAMNWLARLAGKACENEELGIVLRALRRGFDNAEGISLPAFLLQTFASLPVACDELTIPNYVESFLSGTKWVDGKPQLDEDSLESFRQLWSQALARFVLLAGDANAPRISVLEPACGSANDYRFLHSYGIARHIDYMALDLSSTNVETARAFSPELQFQSGYAFELPAPDQWLDYAFVHDLFEHLSPAGLNVAVTEICRVTRQGICAGFFNMDEFPEHVVQPVEDSHWNKLSLARVKELFATNGFIGQIVHVGTFLRQQLGCDETHNPNAYTFLLWRISTG